MTKLLAVARHEGEMNGFKFEKAVLMISENNQWPKLANMDWKRYEEIVNESGDPVGKEVKLLYEQSYGKMKLIDLDY